MNVPIQCTLLSFIRHSVGVTRVNIEFACYEYYYNMVYKFEANTQKRL